MTRTTTRRVFIEASLKAGAALLGVSTEDGWSAIGASHRCPPDPFAGGRLAGTLPLQGRGAADVPLGILLGSGLDARLLTDLSTLTPETLVTPSERFYVRTAFPDLEDATAPWKIRIRGLVKRPVDVGLDDLTTEVVPAGPYLMECAGNNNPRNFGLMSAARWAGVPIGRVLARAEILPRATRVLISGFDRHSQPSSTSVPGASWIFTFAELEAAGALLATEMNGMPLARDHGFPVRLVVPRWYGCASIKWVNDIVLVDETEPATPHMQEFAARTFQAGRPALARDFKPASMDQAAMPVRIEKWILDGRIAYRIVGIIWGGSKPTDALSIRFNANQPYAPVTVCPRPATNDTWTLWSHLWRPKAPGRYRIAMRVDDPTIPTERLDLFFYAREVEVDEV